MLSSSYTFLFIGRSGCGKGTQAELLKDYLEKNDTRPVFYIYAGNRMRNLIKKENSLTSQKAKEIMLAGAKQPDFLAIWAWSNEFVEKIKEDMHLIIDGSPRTILEAMILDEAFEFYKREIVKPILLDVSREWAKDKLLKRARFDDTEERIDSRLYYFEKYVQPAIDYFETKSKNKLVRINGEPTIEEIHQDIIKKVF